MKKAKIIALIVVSLLFLFILASCDPVVSASDFQMTLTEDKSGYIVSRYSGSDNNVVIPSAYNGKPVTKIGDNAFSDCTKITSVTIPSSIKNIGSLAFYRCNNLAGVYIDDLAAWCGISFSDGYSNPLYYAGKLYHQNQLVSQLVLPNGVTKINSYAFYRCNSITSAYIPQSVTKIDSYAFSGCEELASISLNDGLEVVGDYVFNNCPALANIGISSGNANFISLEGSLYSKDGKTLIQYAVGKTEMYFALPSSVTNIKKGALNNCKNIVSFEVPWDNLYYEAIGGNLYTKGGDTLVQYAAGRYDPFFNVPQNVTGIGEGAFSGCLSLINVIIPDTVTNIGEGAFDNCGGMIYEEYGNCFYLNNWLIKAKSTAVTEITIKSDSLGIAGGAFKGCSYLKNVYVPDSVKNIGKGAFSGCSGLTSIVLPFAGSCYDAFIPSSQTLFGYIFGTDYYKGSVATTQFVDSSFTAYEIYYLPFNLRSVIVTSEDILSYTFNNCSRLSSIMIQNTQDIGEGAFRNCSSLLSMTVPNSVINIGKGAFYGCSSLANITLPFAGASRSDGENFFFGYIFGADSIYSSADIPLSLKTAVITDITSVRDYTFYNCGTLTDITLPTSVISIGEGAFNGCVSLENLYIPDSVTNIAEGAFLRCDSLNYHEEGDCLYIGNWLIAAKHTGVFSVTLKSKTVGIYHSAFSHCTSLANITIGGEVVSIGDYAFGGCSDLVNIIIPNGVKYIGSRAFYGCTKLTNIVIPDSVKGINQETFYNCLNLTSIVLGKGVESIGKNAFSYCAKLESIVLPNNITSIGKGALSGCVSLKSLTLPFVGASKNSDIGAYLGYLFGADSSNNHEVVPASLKTVSITDAVKIGGYAFYNCANLTEISLPSGLTSIGDYAFSGCSSLGDIVIPANVTHIGIRAFYGAGLVSVIIPDKVTEINQETFSNCSNLENVTFGKGITGIGKKAFSGCLKLKNIALTNAVIIIDDYAFENCEELTQLSMGNYVEIIGAYAFSGCTGLTDIIIPASVTYIKSNSFSGCENIIFFCIKRIKPVGWEEGWNNTDHPVYWSEQWELVEGVPTPIAD